MRGGKNGFGWGGREEGKWGYVKPPTRKLVKMRNYIFPVAFRLEALRALTTFLGAADSLTM